MLHSMEVQSVYHIPDTFWLLCSVCVCLTPVVHCDKRPEVRGHPVCQGQQAVVAKLWDDGCCSHIFVCGRIPDFEGPWHQQ